jgi:hypothetical protein
MGSSWDTVVLSYWEGKESSWVIKPNIRETCPGALWPFSQDNFVCLKMGGEWISELTHQQISLTLQRSVNHGVKPCSQPVPYL